MRLKERAGVAGLTACARARVCVESARSATDRRRPNDRSEAKAAEGVGWLVGCLVIDGGRMVQLGAVDHSARESMKSAASCVT